MQVDMAWMQGGFTSMANGGNFWSGAGKGLATGLMNAGLSFLNIPGAIPNGLLHAGGNVLSNGITNRMWGNDFLQGAWWQAGFGFAGGAYSGYQLATERGLNYWWGTKTDNWGYGRHQGSFLPWRDKPNIIDFNSISYTGVPMECDALTMATIDPLYTPEQWQNFILDYTDGNTVNYNQMYKDYGLESLRTNNANLTGSEIQNIVNQGYNNASFTVNNYYDINGNGPGTHRMTVNQVKYTDKYVKLKVSDWGWGKSQNGVTNYNMVYRMGKTKFNPLYFNFFK
jgi:hypothetical protein